ncbi:MAG: pilus assembly protein [Methylobacter sp.]|nr:pilus assembly protein [Methylobacter sp.]
MEFTLIALLFFAVLFAIIEFSRALFVWNALTEATRRGARMAVICPVGSGIPKQVAIFGDKGGSLTTSPIVVGLTPDMVNVSYFDQAGAVSADPTLIRFAEVNITGYTHTLIIPLWGSSITAPAFTTTLPTESLGAVPTYSGDPVITPDCNF